MREWRKDHKRVKWDYGGEKSQIQDERWSARARSNHDEQGKKAQKSLSQGGDFGWRVGGRSFTSLNLGMGANGSGEDGIRKEEDDRMGRLMNSNPYIKTLIPFGSWWDLQVCH